MPALLSALLPVLLGLLILLALFGLVALALSVPQRL